MNHFPGPWLREGATIKAISHGTRFTIAKACASKFTAAGNESTAKLIAAAPDLYRALAHMVETADSADFNGSPSDAAMSEARQVLAYLAK